MAAARPWTDSDDARLRELHAAGKTLHAIAADMRRSKDTISRKAKALGLAWDRSATVSAVAARVADARERRSRLEVQLLDDAEKIRAQIWTPHTYFDWGGKDHDYDERTMPEPTPTDKLKLMQAAGAAIDRSLKISVHDSDTGAEQVKSLLGGLAAALGLPAGPVDGAPASDG